MLARLNFLLPAFLLVCAGCGSSGEGQGTTAASAAAPFVGTDAPADPKAAAARLATTGTQPDSLHLLSPGSVSYTHL